MMEGFKTWQSENMIIGNDNGFEEVSRGYADWLGGKDK